MIVPPSLCANRTRSRTRLARPGCAVWALLGFLMLAGPVGAQFVSVPRADHVTVQAEAIPLAALLRELQSVMPLDVQIDPKVADRPVSVRVTDELAFLALRQVLIASGLDHVLMGTGRPGGSAVQVHIGDLDAPTVSLGALGGAAPSWSPPAPFSPAAERDQRDRDDELEDEGSQAGGPDGEGGRELAPGEVTPERMVELLAPQPRPQRDYAELPFPDENGQPIRVPIPPGPRTVATLPFPDANGQPIQVPIPPRPASGVIELPFTQPDGTPYTVVIQPPPPPELQTSPVPTASVSSPTPGTVPQEPHDR